MADVHAVERIFKKAVDAKSSDLHIVAFEKPIIRVNDELKKLEEEETLTEKGAEEFILATLRPEFVDRLKMEREVDFSFNFSGARVRSNIFYQEGTVSASYRFITENIRLFDELGLPPVMEEFATKEQGLVIITGPTGHGKSTSIAAMIEFINQSRAKHIVTIEDPVEYVFKNEKSIVTQRELGVDTLSFKRALRSVLREDPDVVFIGEMRDLATFEAALTIAETGHLVFTTLHTNNAFQAPQRIIDVFPSDQQDQVRQQLANVLSGVVSQRLIQKTDGGSRILACEVLIANDAVKALIREQKTHQLQSIIQTGASEGMITMDKVLADYVSKGDITLEEGIKWANDVKLFKQMVF